MLLVGTDNELVDLDADRRLAEGRVTALAGHGSDIVALLDRRRVVRVDGGGGGVVQLGALDTANGQSLVVDAAGDPIVGFQGARLARLRSGRPELLTGFDDVPGRSSWENPAGPEPDARSLAVSDGGGLWVNVHVGGVWWSDDHGATWREAIAPPADVHEVVADGEDRVAVAAAVGFGWSADHGTTWTWTTDGLHASYARAVALDGDAVLVSASTGPYTRQAGVYRAQLGQAFERCEQGLPEWFSTNVDTGCLALSGSRAVIGSRDGTVYTSDNRGATWQIAAKGLGSVDVVQLR